ncbi:MAG: 2-oxo acid dehydrogenase subunit E2 [Firmicutes bacterium]|nr:2-oxo acid dehydrogenase subunit E2 [Bacillota bacterium]MBE3590887.1 2-oxo acid dehydrogenase subunit E2 [Bacillota bacterium]
MPQLGESVTEGTVSAWLKKPGDRVERYESLLEVITDKVNAEVPSPHAGVVKALLVKEGDTVPVGTPICILEAEGEGEADASAAEGHGPAAGAAPAGSAEPGAGAVTAASTESPQPFAPGQSERGRYSPAVRRLAREHGVDLTQVRGTGAGGRVTREDVERFVAQRAAGAPAPAAPAAVHRAAEAPAAHGAPAAPAPKLGPDDELLPLTPIRRTIARNMVLSASTIPHAWTMVEADVTGIERLIEARGAEFRAREGVPLTFLPFAVKAAVEALKVVPRLNATWSEEGIILHRRVHIGIAVATEEGLVVPVVHDADRLSIAGLAAAIADLAARARAGTLKLDDMQGGTFTVDNTGAVGTELSVPILVPGQTGILTTERAKKKPVVVGDAIAIRTMMALCLSIDHRVVDGAEAGRFLTEVRRRLESVGPETGLY